MRNTFTTITLFSLFHIGIAQKITLLPSMLTNITAKGNEQVLIDEQHLDPKSNPQNKPTSDRFTIQEPDGAINPLYLPMEVIIDLKATHQLSDIYFYFLHGSSDSVFFYSGTPNNWSSPPIVAAPTSGWDTWKGFSISVSTRYLKLTIKNTNAQLREIAIYGSPTGSPSVDPLPTGTAPVPVTIWDFAGSNIFEDGWNDSILNVSGSHRVYYDLRWFDYDLSNDYPNNLYSFGKFDSGNRKLDSFFETWKSNKTHLYLCLKENSERFIIENNNADGANLWKPIAANANAEDPNAYIEHADAMFQVAARYGSKNVNQSLLRVNTQVSTVRTGLNYFQYIENGNENNKNWRGRKAYWTPYEYAAMSSADYDGHEGTMGPNLGIKAADPNMKLVMSATISPDTAYIKAMAHWTTHFRNDKKFIWDVINFHHYSNNGGGQTGIFDTGVSPESDHLYEKLKEVVDFTRKYWPEKEVWWSEFGYDLSTTSPQHTPTVSGQTAEQVQANLIVRSFLIAAAAGIDRAQQYMLRHSFFDASAAGLFNSCGLVDKGGYSSQLNTVVPPVPHPSWYAMFTMRTALKNFVFDEFVSMNEVYVLKFKHISAIDSIAYALWSPTTENKTTANYLLAIPNANAVSKISYLPQSKFGTNSNLAVSNQTVRLDVNESPVYVLAKLSSTPVGNETLVSERVNIAPNPTEGDITVQLSAAPNLIQLYTGTGNEVYTKIHTEANPVINTSNLSSGLYIMSITHSDGKVVREKFIKQ